MKSSCPKQFRGTAVFSIDRAAHRAIDKGMDNTGLGRWSWARYRGKHLHVISVLSAYRPNPPGGPFTAYAQQARYFNSKVDSRCPRNAFIKDLCLQLKQMLDQGDHIALLIDGNLNMGCSDLQMALEDLTIWKPSWQNMAQLDPLIINATRKRNRSMASGSLQVLISKLEVTLPLTVSS